MDPESKKLLEDTFKLAKDNNVILRKIRRRQKWSSFMQVIYWLIIIGISVGAFYLLQPYVNKMMTLYNQISGSSQTVNSVNLNSIGDMLKNYKITPK
jgi:hypothetical protein